MSKNSALAAFSKAVAILFFAIRFEKSLGEGEVPISTHSYTPVLEIYIKAAEEKKVSVATFRLIFAGRFLDFDREVGDFYKANNSELLAKTQESKLKNGPIYVKRNEDARKVIGDLKNKDDLRNFEILEKIFSYEQPTEAFLVFIRDLHQKGYFMKDSKPIAIYRNFIDKDFLMDHAIEFMISYKPKDLDSFLTDAIAFYITRARILEDAGKRERLRFFPQQKREDFIHTFNNFSPIKYNKISALYSSSTRGPSKDRNCSDKNTYT